ncbi:MAG: ABC transporter permease [Bacteroidales bacterium]|nr:ABC transporter permease [Bacteroidales bacterium]
MMDASFFIAGRLRFKGKIAMVCIAVSFLVMIIAVSVSSGYRQEIRSSISSISGDVMILRPDQNIFNEDAPIEASPAYLPFLQDVPGVSEVIPSVYRSGIVRHDGNMYGIVLKGLPDGVVRADSVALGVSIPSRLAEKTGLKEGDRMLTYFVGEKTKVRQFTVASVYEALAETDDRHLVYASNADLQRLNGWNEGEVSAIEIVLDRDSSSEEDIRRATEEAGMIIYAFSDDDEESVISVSSVSKYPQLFSWLDLIDFNVFFILLLMTVVAGFNMISGLLIMLFEHVSTIGLLKSLGMSDRSIAKVFLSVSASVVAKGLLIGNALALLFCVIQDTTHLIRLDPVNYYVSYVPVNVDPGYLLTVDLVSFLAIMVLLLIPCLFISRVDPADTMRVK